MLMGHVVANHMQLLSQIMLKNAHTTNYARLGPIKLKKMLALALALSKG